MKVLDYGGTMLCMVSYLMITSGNANLFGWGLMVGTVGSTMLMVLAARYKIRGLMGLQGFFICVNLVALIRTIGG